MITIDRERKGSYCSSSPPQDNQGKILDQGTGKHWSNFCYILKCLKKIVVFKPFIKHVLPTINKLLFEILNDDFYGFLNLEVNIQQLIVLNEKS